MPFSFRPDPTLTRRRMLESTGLGFGSLALKALMFGDGALAAPGHDAPQNLSPRQGHHRPKARAVIQLIQNGGPSQIDLFDPKPELEKRSGESPPMTVESFFTAKNANILMRSQFDFAKYGQSGMDFSEVVSNLGGVADDLCMIRSMYTEHNNHPEALTMLQTCKVFPGRPAMGSWISYALGTENQNLPAYIVLRDPAGYSTNGKTVWSSGFLPALYQGVEVSSEGSPVHYLHPAESVPATARSRDLELLQRLNARHRDLHPRESELEARIQNYELAARMQLSADELLDISKESAATRKLYGMDDPLTAGYGTRCLMARRLVEQGVRFVQVFPPLDPSFQPWDWHDDVRSWARRICARTDLPAAGLIHDLKSSGLLDEVIVMWSGEFGRLPIVQGGAGRDHNRHAFTILIAGGGFKPGLVYGETDEFSYKSVVDRVSVPDLHATILWQIGLDHKKLIYHHQGIEETPTDSRVNDARVIRDLMAAAV